MMEPLKVEATFFMMIKGLMGAEQVSTDTVCKSILGLGVVIVNICVHINTLKCFHVALLSKA